MRHVLPPLLVILASCSSDEPDGLTAPGWFTDITESTGIDFVHENGMKTSAGGDHRYLETVGGGLALFDFDGDGWLDIYLVNGNRFAPPDPRITNRLYRNQQDGTFADVTAKAGVGDPSYGQGATAADFDGDGDQDLYVTNYGPDRFYRNEGDGTFKEIGAAVGVQNDGFGQMCAFLDYDGDGDLDLYVQNYIEYSTEQPRADYASPRAFEGQADLLFRNDHGKFTEVSKAAGIYRKDGRGMGAVCADLDGDGDVDVFVANDGMANFFFENLGGGKFKERSVRSGLAYDHEGDFESSMGADLGDVDGDGRPDIACPALRAEGCTLYKNLGKSFEDWSRAAGLETFTRAHTGFSPNLIDADNDGDLDLFLCNGGVSSNLGVAPGASYAERFGIVDLLAINDGTGHFRDGSAQAGAYFARRLIGRGSAHGDLDNDGDLDLVINNLTGPAIVLRNDAPAANWITLDLRGKGMNRDAIHARVQLTAGGKTQTTLVRSAGSYLSLNDRRPHFGLGQATRIDKIEVTWPNGEKTSITDARPNQLLKVVQP